MESFLYQDPGIFNKAVTIDEIIKNQSSTAKKKAPNLRRVNPE